MVGTTPWNLMGLTVSGDVDGLTIYTDRRGRKIAFPKSPPKTSPSPAQVRQRERFRTAQLNWSALTDLEKRNLEDAVRITNIVMTGQNLFVSVSLTNDQPGYQTVARQATIDLPTATFIP